MTALRVPAVPRPAPAKPGHLRAAARLLRLELRRNAMPWMLPVAVGLFWFTTYRKAMAMPPLWSLRAASVQLGAVLAFACPVAGAAAWMGSREARRRTTDLVTITARPRWARQLATWAATTIWATVGYLGCVAAVYGVTAQQAAWGGPLWWPVAVGAATLSALSAVGFAAGALISSRFTAPVVAVAAFFTLALSTQLIQGSQSYWQVSPVVTGPWDASFNAGTGTFYSYLPDLSIAQVIFLAGLTVAVLAAMALPRGPSERWLRRPAAVIATTGVLATGVLAAGTAVVLAGTGKLDAQGMIAIPALHDAASDRPLSYAPVCSHTPIPVCLNPAYTSDLPATAAALTPVLNEIAGLPGAPARISQAAAIYRQGTGNSVSVSMAGPALSGTPPVFRLLLPVQLPGPTMTTSEWAAAVRSTAGPAILADVIGDGPGATPAQRAVAAALRTSAGLPEADLRTAPNRQRPSGTIVPLPVSVQSAARRFAALPAPARHAWLVRHLPALRAGRITLAQLP
jgi:hypothetical protein